MFTSDVESEAFDFENALIQKHLGPALVNIKGNPNRKEHTWEDIHAEDMSFPVKVVDNTEYVSVKYVLEGFGMNMRQFNFYVNVLSLPRHRFPFDRKTYILKTDLQRIKDLIESNR